ncbi:MAG: hypothetical protein U0X74_02210 [Anaerolineales bacterium]
MKLKQLNKKAAARAPQPINDKGTERDLGTVNRRTQRRQFANCDEIDKVEGEHQECAPFFVNFWYRLVVYTSRLKSVKVKVRLEASFFDNFRPTKPTG